MSLFDDLDKVTDDAPIIRAPFGYPGGKSRSLNNILPHLPYRDIYVEPFGGSAAVLLARHKSKLEVFNDRYAGVVAFYRCLRNQSLLTRLIDLMEHSVHSREDWYLCHDTWENVEDEVERAFRWYYMTVYSFAQIGRTFGRATKAPMPLAGKLRNKIKNLPEIHERMRNVQIENLDWYDVCKHYDSSNTVFYLDPPYVDTYQGAHKHVMTIQDHTNLLDFVFECEGFVAVSGYSNPLYENRDWSERYSWKSFVSLQSVANNEGNKKEGLHTEREHAEEVLWIK